MSANRLNNYEDPQSLPEGFAFRQEAVWQQLENKLHPPVRNRRPFYYTAAAACLLLIAGAYYLQQEGPAVKPATTVALSQPAASPKKPADAASTTKHETTITSATVTASLHKIKTSKETPAPAIIAQAPTAIIQQTSTVQDTMIKAVPNDATAGTATTPQRRFRIAHANEVSAPPAMPQLLTKEPGKIYARLHPTIDIPEISTAPAEPVRQRGFFGIVRNNQ
jgi:hypothetical protein